MGALQRQKPDKLCDSNSPTTKIVTFLLVKFIITFIKMWCYVIWASQFKSQSLFNVESLENIIIVSQV